MKTYLYFVSVYSEVPLLHLFFNEYKRNKYREVVVAQLAEWSLPIPEDPGTNPVIGNFY